MVDLGQLLGRRAHVIGSTLRNRSDAFKSSLISDLQVNVYNIHLAEDIAFVIAREAFWELTCFQNLVSQLM